MPENWHPFVMKSSCSRMAGSPVARHRMKYSTQTNASERAKGRTPVRMLKLNQETRNSGRRGRLSEFQHFIETPPVFLSAKSDGLVLWRAFLIPSISHEVYPSWSPWRPWRAFRIPHFSGSEFHFHVDRESGQPGRRLAVESSNLDEKARLGARRTIPIGARPQTRTAGQQFPSSRENGDHPDGHGR
jgi:hypothetical protein